MSQRKHGKPSIWANRRHSLFVLIQEVTGHGTFRMRTGQLVVIGTQPHGLSILSRPPRADPVEEVKET